MNIGNRSLANDAENKMQWHGPTESPSECLACLKSPATQFASPCMNMLFCCSCLELAQICTRADVCPLRSTLIKEIQGIHLK